MSQYNVILADCPWSYSNKKTGGSLKSGAAAKYPCMTTEEIKALPVRSIAEKNSCLFLWGTVPMLPDALQVMEAWGYKYKTMLTWRKVMSLGMGYWYRGQCEHLLLGVRGKVKAFRYQHPNFIQAKVGRHSEKPREFYELIENSTAKIPDRKMVELFARAKRVGWDAWGNEVESDLKLAA
jgi:N6-adenosine-specific RNA methylase IME4